MATIQSVEECGPIALVGGSVVTGRFTTSRVDVIVRLTVAAADGTTEVLEGTTVHPVWSVDRHDWVKLSELQPGERLQATDCDATVISVAIVPTTVPVYNIEVHGEHVYQVGELGCLFHNSCIEPGTVAWTSAVTAIRNATKGVNTKPSVRWYACFVPLPSWTAPL